jgi:hypothetical protein
MCFGRFVGEWTVDGCRGRIGHFRHFEETRSAFAGSQKATLFDDHNGKLNMEQWINLVP